MITQEVRVEALLKELTSDFWTPLGNIFHVTVHFAWNLCHHVVLAVLCPSWVRWHFAATIVPAPTVLWLPVFKQHSLDVISAAAQIFRAKCRVQLSVYNNAGLNGTVPGHARDGFCLCTARHS